MLTLIIFICFVISVTGAIYYAINGKDGRTSCLFVLSWVLMTVFCARLFGCSPFGSYEWEHNTECCHIRTFINNVSQNSKDYEITVNSNSTRIDARESTIYIKEKSTGNTHKIYINDTISNSWIEWTLNDELVFKNGYLKDGTEVWKFVDGKISSECINNNIIALLNELAKNHGTFNVVSKKNGLGDTSLLKPGAQDDTKTLEIVAPQNTTITGTVEKDGKVIYNETI